MVATSDAESRHQVQLRAPTNPQSLEIALQIDGSGVASGPAAADDTGDGQDQTPILGRIGAADIDADGNLLVADYQQNQILVFGSTGQFVRSIGGPGQGPGEFQIPVAVGTLGDTVFVFDNQLYRLSLFNRGDGSFIGSTNLKRGEWRPRTVVGITATHAVAVAGPPPPPGMVPGQMVDEEVRLVPFPGDGEGRTIWRTPGTDWKQIEVNGVRMLRNMPLSPNSTCDFQERTGYCAYQKDVAVHAFDLVGTSLGSVSVSAPERRVSASERESILASFANRALRDQMIIPDYHPAFSASIVADDRGRVWFRREANSDTNTEYWIIDRRTETATSVVMEGSVVIEAVRDGRALGRARDSDGSESVVVYLAPD